MATFPMLLSCTPAARLARSPKGPAVHGSMQRSTWATAAYRRQDRFPSIRASSVDADNESRLEALESMARGGKEQKGAVEKRPSVRPNLTQAAKADMGPSTEWGERDLFPKGWDDMPLPMKVSQLWMGKRGLLFWSNKLAWAAVIGVGVLWVVFRFVGPALGLYQLQSDLTTPNLL
ncbi:CGL3 [Auxenochlorella protothecoides x Auxenochlorella symbiontica]